MKILFTGGGTGGHIVPILAIVREIRKLKESGLQLFYIGPKDDFNELLLSGEGIQTFTIAAGKMRRYGGIQTIFQNFFDLFFKTPFGIIQAFFKVLFLAPDLIFSKGGYGAIPATLAGWILRVPVFLHEGDSVPGLANRIASVFSLKIFVSFPRTQKFPIQKTLITGNPIRKEILTGSKEEAAQLFHLVGGKPILLILGGSQGSQKINDIVLLLINDALNNFEIIHQTGEKNFLQVKAEAKTVINPINEKYYHPVSFLKETELRHAYATADFIVNRAGSGSIFEIAALGKPSILIPLAGAAQNHQVENAYAFAKDGAAIVLEEANLTPHFFLEKLRSLFQNPQELAKMSQAAHEFAKPEAANFIAQYLIEYLKNE